MSDNITGTWVTFERGFKSRPTVEELHEFTVALPEGARVQFTEAPRIAGLGGFATLVKVRYQIADDRITDVPGQAP